MFIIDDILLAPVKGLLYIFKEIQKAAEGEIEDTPEKLKKELLELQMLFETDQITEKEYSKKEKEILQRMNALQKSRSKRSLTIIKLNYKIWPKRQKRQNQAQKPPKSKK